MVEACSLCALGLAATLTCLVVNCCHAHLVFGQCLCLVVDLFHVHRVFHECLYLVVNLLRWPLGSFAKIFSSSAYWLLSVYTRSFVNMHVHGCWLISKYITLLIWPQHATATLSMIDSDACAILTCVRAFFPRTENFHFPRIYYVLLVVYHYKLCS